MEVQILTIKNKADFKLTWHISHFIVKVHVIVYAHSSMWNNVSQAHLNSTMILLCYFSCYYEATPCDEPTNKLTSANTK